MITGESETVLSQEESGRYKANTHIDGHPLP